MNSEHKTWAEKTPEEQAAAAEKMKACNDRCYARMMEINRISNETIIETTHVEYKPGQYGNDYQAFGKAMCEIRKLVKESVFDVAPDYEMLARQFMRPSFDADKLAKAIEALASEQPVDYPTFYTPGRLVELAKKIEGGTRSVASADGTEAVPPLDTPAVIGCPSLGPEVFPSGADGTEPADSVRKAPEKLDAFCQAELQREEARRLRKIVWKCYGTKVDLAVMGKKRCGGKVYEVRVSKRKTDVSDTYAQLKVNGKTVLTGGFTGSAEMARRMFTAAAQALVNHKAKRGRDKRRRNAKRKAAAKAAETQALIEKELA